MNTCNYVYELASAPESNNTLVGKTKLRVLDCALNVQNNELCGLWNFSHCPSDKDYCQPFVKGDVIYKQFYAPRDYYYKTFVHIIDTATGLDITNGISYYTTEAGYDINDNKFVNLIIDTSKLETTKCFYVKVVGFTCRFKEPSEISAYNACVADLVADGYTTAEAQEICLTSMCAGNMDVMFSEPYCQESCVNTILIEGFYPKYDCNGNFYGTFTSGSTTNSYIPKLRIYASLEPSEANIEETTVNNIRKQTKLIKTFILMSYPLPYYAVEQLSNIFASKTIKVEGEEYLRALSLQKNNDEGTMWVIKTTLFQECTSTNFTCD